MADVSAPRATARSPKKAMLKISVRRGRRKVGIGSTLRVKLVWMIRHLVSLRRDSTGRNTTGRLWRTIGALVAKSLFNGLQIVTGMILLD
ncbi:MAG: hypothetical protein ACOYLL_01475 [Beijerinckiaceae bacterium]